MKPCISARSLGVLLALLALSIGGCDNGGSGDDGGSHSGMDGSTPHGDGGSNPGIDSGRPGVDAGHGGCVPTFEICGDHMDQNCDGHDTSCGNTDGDGYEACRPGEAPPACDCDDSNASVFPGAPEQCDGVDNDCNGRVDEAAACCAACAGMAERADICTTAGACVCSTEGAGDAPCPAGETCCTSGCVNTQTDVNNCNGCGAACGCTADRCEGGVCRCGDTGACDFVYQCVSGSCGSATCP